MTLAIFVVIGCDFSSLQEIYLLEDTTYYFFIEPIVTANIRVVVSEYETPAGYSPPPYFSVQASVLMTKPGISEIFLI